MIIQDRTAIARESLSETCRRYHVRKLALFGSVLREDFRADSDIDVLVAYEPGAQMSLFNHFGLDRELEQLFGREINLISKRGLRPLLRKDVLRTAATIYAT